MPWQIGVDEAGYGPNLGPFVMTLVACRVPAESVDDNLWDLLKAGVRRAEDRADERLVVADSKLVYAPARGWVDLERSALAAVGEPRATLRALMEQLSAAELPLLEEEAWFQGDTELPTEVLADELATVRDLWRRTSERAGVAWVHCQSVIVPAPRFNDLIDRWDSKGAVLSIALAQLIERCVHALPEEPMRFVIDKHGGRNTYSALLQQAFPVGMVLAEKECAARSVYRVEGMNREVRITFMPKADVEHFTVALASMMSKFVRELLMREFNRFWLTHVPGLKPTAGYPGDSARYFESIRPALVKLGIAERAVWRCR